MPLAPHGTKSSNQIVEDLTIEQLPSLTEIADRPVVTLLCPIRRPDERARAQLEWRGLVAAARAELLAGAVDDETGRNDRVEAMLIPAENLPGRWPTHDRAVAYVASPTTHRFLRARRDVEPCWSVGDTPAFAALARAGRHDAFLLLALGQHDTHLYEVDAGVARLLAVHDLPARLEEAVPAREHGQHFNRHGGAHPGGKGVVATIHGEDDAGIEHEHELDAFCRRVDGALWRHLGVDDPRPLVVGGVGDLAARLRRVSHHPRLITAVVEGTSDHADLDRLVERAGVALAHHWHAGRDATVDRFRAGHGAGLASDDPAEIASAARDGRVEVVLVADPPNPAVADTAMNRAIDDALAVCLAHRCRVDVADDDALAPIAAVFRW